jgi:manganese transport protein
MGPAAAQPPPLTASPSDTVSRRFGNGAGLYEDSYEVQGGFAELGGLSLTLPQLPPDGEQIDASKTDTGPGIEVAPGEPDSVSVRVSTDRNTLNGQLRFRWKRALQKLGPAFLISIGYMDPGNWATDIEGGSRFGYQLLWVLVLSNAMAWLLQTLASRLGIVTQRHLAQLCREAYPRFVALSLFALAQVAIVATDIAEVIGTAVGLNLVLGVPLLLGVLLTVLDTLLLLLAQRRSGIRRIEQIVFSLLLVISACFGVELVLSRPSFVQVVGGLVPRMNGQSLLVALGMLGATVMPHNFYLHSAIVIRRVADQGLVERLSPTANPARPPHPDEIGVASESQVRQQELECMYSAIDCAVALNAAFFINAAILITAASSFWANHIAVKTLQEAHALLERVLPMQLWGHVEVAPLAFGIALIAAGQSSTLTGTLAGQYVMEGFLGLTMRMWQQRLLTRLCAVVPSALAIIFLGPQSTYRLLILSQVVLSLQLPFAMIPMIRFTSSKALMGQHFASGTLIRVCAWAATGFIVALNLWMAGVIMVDASRALFSHAGSGIVLGVLSIPVSVYLLGLLLWLCLHKGFGN